MQSHLETAAKWTDENVLDLVRKVRNDLIKDFLDDRFLKQYLHQEFGIRELSAVKIEFIRTSLKELLIQPVDVIHYEPIIRQIRDTDTASLTEKNEELFYQEIDRTLKNYMY
jgi:hypothetical protein